MYKTASQSLAPVGSYIVTKPIEEKPKTEETNQATAILNCCGCWIASTVVTWLLWYWINTEVMFYVAVGVTVVPVIVVIIIIQ